MNSELPLGDEACELAIAVEVDEIDRVLECDLARAYCERVESYAVAGLPDRLRHGSFHPPYHLDRLFVYPGSVQT